MTSDREIARSLSRLMDDVEGKKEQNVLTSLAIRSMAKAIYTTKKTSHYGLGFDFYTHFTSPIRRYPDVLAHRLLDHYLLGGPSASEEAYEKMSLHASQMEKKAADAERASVKYKQAEYLENNIGTEYNGIISGVTEWGMYVEIIENKCEGMVRLRDITDDFYVLDEKNYCIVGQRKKKVYQLGDEVTIRVKKVDLSKRQIDFSLVPDDQIGRTTDWEPQETEGQPGRKERQDKKPQKGRKQPEKKVRQTEKNEKQPEKKAKRRR
jgi:ribonuclease R